MGWLARRKRKLAAARVAGEVSGITVAVLHHALMAYPRLRAARLDGDDAALEDVRGYAKDLAGLTMLTAEIGAELELVEREVPGPARAAMAVMQLLCAYVALGQRPVDERALLSKAD